MTIAFFVILLTVLSLITGLVMEAIKKVIGEKFEYAKNLIVGIISIVLGCGGCVIAYIFLGIPFTAVTIICIFLMGLAVWLVSMVGYDKVVQTIAQIMKLFGK